MNEKVKEIINFVVVKNYGLKENINDEKEALDMKIELEKNTKIECAKAIIDKLIGMECTLSDDPDSEVLSELTKIHDEVYAFNEEVIDDLLESYRTSFRKTLCTDEEADN